MTQLKPTITLTDEQVAFFKENGYLSIDAITTPEEIARITTIYDDLFTRKAGRERGDQFDLGGADEDDKQAVLPQILNPSRYAPELAETLYHANALAIARQLLGEEARYNGDHAIMKPPHSPAPTPWHQDEAYWNPSQTYSSLSVWMPLQAVDTHNGCMEFIPKSQALEILPHRSIGGDQRVHGLELDADYDLSQAVACPLPAGGATFHASTTLHYTSANNSDEPRRAYILIFGLPATPRAEPRRFPWLEGRETARERRAETAPSADDGKARLAP
jgi:ectoine hydroxylase-related dioxygenase (phytanoyl-CoA dioxygenase family)